MKKEDTNYEDFHLDIFKRKTTLQPVEDNFLILNRLLKHNVFNTAQPKDLKRQKNKGRFRKIRINLRRLNDANKDTRE